MAIVLLLWCLLFLSQQAVAQEEVESVRVDGHDLSLLQPIIKSKGENLYPLDSIAKNMGSAVEFDAPSGIITVRRSQDASIATYNTRTGDFVVNGISSGTILPETPGIFTPNQISVPSDLLAVLLGATVKKLSGAVEINRAEIKSAEIVRPSYSWKDVGLDYVQGEIGEYSVKLNPEIQGQPTQYSIVENMYAGGGGHVGPTTFNGGCRLQGGTDGKFLTFNSANLNVRKTQSGWIFLGGDNPLKGYQGRQLNGYPVRGAQLFTPMGKLSFNKFIGAGFTKGVPVGGGTVRLSYQRFMSTSELCYRPSARLRGSVATVFFKDHSPFVNNTKQHGYYVHSTLTYNGKSGNIFAEGFLGQGRRTQKAQGTAYFLDVVAQKQFGRKLGIFAEYDRINPNFSHPQIGNSMVNRQDALTGVNFQLSGGVKGSCNYSFNQSLLDAKKPSSLQIINSSFNLSPFGGSGPSINLLGTQSFFAPAITGDARADSSAKPSKSTVGTISIDDTILGTQFTAGATTSVVSTKDAFKPTLSNSINLTANRGLGRLGSVQVLSQIGIFTTRTSTRTFDIRAIYKTPPLIFNTGLLFGSGYSRAGEFQRYTFTASLVANVPYIGSYSMNVARQLAQTNSTGKLVRTVYLNKGRGRSELEAAANGRIPPFGSISGVVFESVVLPPATPQKTPRIHGIKILLDGQEGISRESDNAGKWVFNDIPAGRHKVSISLKSTPASLAIMGAQSFVIVVSPGQVTTVNFALAKLSSLSGKIGVQTQTANGAKDLAGSIRLFVKEKDFDTLSEGDGSFSITDLPPGKYHVAIDPDFLPENYEALPPEVEVSLGSGQILKGLQFVIREKPRQIQKKVF